MNGTAHLAEMKKVQAEEKAAKDIQQRMRRGVGSFTAEEREILERVQLRQVEERRARLWQSMTQAERRQFENPLANPWPESRGRLVVNPCGIGG